MSFAYYQRHCDKSGRSNATCMLGDGSCGFLACRYDCKRRFVCCVNTAPSASSWNASHTVYTRNVRFSNQMKWCKWLVLFSALLNSLVYLVLTQNALNRRVIVCNDCTCYTFPSQFISPVGIKCFFFLLTQWKLIMRNKCESINMLNSYIHLSRVIFMCAFGRQSNEFVNLSINYSLNVHQILSGYHPCCGCILLI
jgi:hypothetical protein